MVDEEYLTQEKYDELKKELDYLKTKRRKEIAESLDTHVHSVIFPRTPNIKKRVSFRPQLRSEFQNLNRFSSLQKLLIERRGIRSRLDPQ
jgi:hypothetical protein